MGQGVDRGDGSVEWTPAADVERGADRRTHGHTADLHDLVLLDVVREGSDALWRVAVVVNEFSGLVCPPDPCVRCRAAAELPAMMARRFDHNHAAWARLLAVRALSTWTFG